MQPSVWAFLRELVLRFGAKNPKIFNIIAWAGAICTFLTGLPALFDQLGIQLPEAWEALQSKFLAGVGIAMVIIANLPVKAEPVAPAQSLVPDAKPGDLVSVTSTSKLPYTTAVQAKEIEATTEPETFTPKVTTDSTKPPTQ